MELMTVRDIKLKTIDYLSYKHTVEIITGKACRDDYLHDHEISRFPSSFNDLEISYISGSNDIDSTHLMIFLGNEAVRLRKEVEELKKEIVRLETAIPSVDDQMAIVEQVQAIETKIKTFGDTAVHTTEELENIEGLINELSEQLSSRDNYSAIKKGITNQENEITQKVVGLSNLEQKKMLLEEYLKVKNNMLSQSLKEYFNEDITFKFLEFTQDGTPKDVFKLLVKGVDYSNANTGAKIIAGIQMIQFFQEKQNLYLPILIDNSEAVVIDLPSIKGQIVTCSAVRNKKLTIGGE